MKKVFCTLISVFLCSFSYGQDQSDNNSKGGVNFIGTWHALNSNDTVTVTRDGGNYTVAQNGETISYNNYKDNVLNNANDASLGKAIFNQFNGHIFWKKKEYEYLTVAPVKVISYPPYAVGSYLDDELSSAESALFQITCNYKHPNKMVYLNYNFHEPNDNLQLVADAIFHGLEKTNKVSRVPYDQYVEHAKETISYFISYSDIDAHTIYLGSVDKDGNQIPNYVAYISFKITVKDENGKLVNDNTFKFGYKPLERVHFPAFTSEDQAIRHGVEKMREQITDFLSNQFHVVTTLSSVDEKGRNETAKTVVMLGGENMGISEQTTFKIMYNHEQIGEVKVKDVAASTSTCKVTDGGDVIAKEMSEGKILDAVSE